MRFRKVTKINKRGSNVTPVEHKLVVKFAKQCLREMCKKQYELMNQNGQPVKYADAVKRLAVTTKCRGQSSHGGAGGITIDLSCFRSGRTKFEEYAAYAKSKLIGDIDYCDDLELLLKALVAHEVAHHIQHRYGPHTRHLIKTYRKSHGAGFQSIYADLRVALINPFVDDAKQEAA